MPTLRIVSDLHVDGHKDGGRSILESIVREDFDILVIAGDLCGRVGLYSALNLAYRAANGRPIVYIAGNHEYYGGTKSDTDYLIREFADLSPNFHVLSNSTCEVNGFRFVGTTLWFKHSGRRGKYDRDLGDFYYIQDIYSWIHREAETSREFLEKTVTESDIVITHHLPHIQSVAPAFQGSPLNSFFLHDLSHVIAEKQPKLWIHGHTHTPADYLVGKTRIVCNPLGYLGEPIVRGFNDSFTVSVE